MVRVSGASERWKFSRVFLGFRAGDDGRGREGEFNLCKERIRPRLKGRAGNFLSSVELPQATLNRSPVLRHFSGGYGMSFMGVHSGTGHIVSVERGMARHTVNVILTNPPRQFFLKQKR
jgi:hypothetical protein